VFLNKVNIDEKYGSAAGVKVWTGTGVEGGITTDDNCNDWTDSTGDKTAFYGTTDSLNADWIETATEDCDNTNRIYCISQQ